MNPFWAYCLFFLTALRIISVYYFEKFGVGEALKTEATLL